MYVCGQHVEHYIVVVVKCYIVLRTALIPTDHTWKCGLRTWETTRLYIGVSSCFRVTNALPSIFLIAWFVMPTIHSKKPLYHGACLGIKRQLTLWRSSSCCSVSDWNNLCRSSAAAARNVEALSEIIIAGMDFRLENLRNANKNVLTVKSQATSMCTVRVTAHVKMQMYTFITPSLSFTYRAPVKSTPVTVNGGASVTQTFGSGGGSGVLKSFPIAINLLQTTQHLSNFLTCWRIDNVQ